MLMGLRRLPIGSARPETPQRGDCLGRGSDVEVKVSSFFRGLGSCVTSFVEYFLVGGWLLF